jgi:hypothetical protein
MGSVIGDILPTALGVAISPVPIIAVILMLLAPHAKAASVAFLVGWVAGIAILVTVVALVVDPRSDSTAGEPSTLSAVLLMVLFVLIASCSIAVPVIGYLVTEARVREPLQDLRAWLTERSAAVMTGLLEVIGVAIIGKGVARL